MIGNETWLGVEYISGKFKEKEIQDLHSTDREFHIWSESYDPTFLANLDLPNAIRDGKNRDFNHLVGKFMDQFTIPRG